MEGQGWGWRKVGNCRQGSGTSLGPQVWEEVLRGFTHGTGGIQESVLQERERERIETDKDSTGGPRVEGKRRGAGTHTGDKDAPLGPPLGGNT